ncbi:hypothetical protein [Methyloglobulus sp.]|uniref:hypothetical protein n=1 Tax=Methyloglobulus sp. TaxID=2518622 RepID=UPI0032B729EB
MNEFLPSRFSENVKRLALGLEPVDAELRLRAPHRVEVIFDSAPLHLPRPPIDHHLTGLHVLLYHPKLVSPVDLRFFDEARRYVPRRLRIPILTRTIAESRPQTHRIRRPLMFPGAAYDVTSNSTGLRGLVLRGGQPMRWARIEARLPGAGRLVGRAHGDDRGEFLLLIGSEASPVGDLNPPLQIEITVLGPAVPPVSSNAERFKIDPLWDLPIEQTALPGNPDPVSEGKSHPTDYTASTMQVVNIIFGKIISGQIFTIL